MKVLVTGARGFVGARIMDEIKEMAQAAPSLQGMDEEGIIRLVDEVQPDVIVHTAAISDISTCEQNPDASYLANVMLPVWLAKTGVKLVAFSSDQVYTGCEEEGPYSEDCVVPGNLYEKNCVMPTNLYARHKLEMEQRTLELNPATVLLRATGMYDMPMYGVASRRNFLMNMLQSATLSFPETQHRAVTYVREVARNIRKAIHLPGGVYNFGSENDLTMLETAQWLKNALSLPVELEEAAPRHNLWMDCTKARQQGISFQNSIDGLRQCILDYGLRSNISPLV